jgi:hypothetical protein
LAKIGIPVPQAKSRGGAPKGNRNACKTGLHRAELRDLRRRIAAFHRRARAAIAFAEEQIAEIARARARACDSAHSASLRPVVKPRESEGAPLVPGAL